MPRVAAVDRVPVVDRVSLISVTNSDNFNRSDSTNNLGSTNEGKVWTQQSGTWGISGNKAYLSSGNGRATIDTGVGDYSQLQVTINMPFGGNAGMVFRYIDESNYLRVEAEQGVPIYRIRKVVAGVTTTLASLSQGVGVGNMAVKVTVDHDFINFYYGGPLKLRYRLLPDEYQQFPFTVTKAGLLKLNGSVTFDDFIADNIVPQREAAV